MDEKTLAGRVRPGYTYATKRVRQLIWELSGKTLRHAKIAAQLVMGSLGAYLQMDVASATGYKSQSKGVPMALRARFVRLSISVEPLQAGAILLLIGILFNVVGALTLADARVALPIDHGEVVKSTGFPYAINWSVNMLVAFPAVVFFLFSAMRLIPDLADDLAARDFVVDPRLTPLGSDFIQKRWELALETVARPALVLSIVGFLASWSEWLTNSGAPLYYGRLNGPTSAEWDWSVGVLLDQSGHFTPAPGIARLANGLFSLLAFTWQGAVAATFGLLLCVTYAFVRWVGDITAGSKASGMPALFKTEDRHYGFEVFARFADTLLQAMVGFWLMFYLSRLWNAYLRSADDSLWDMVVGPISSGLSKGKVGDLLKKVTTTGLADYSSLMVGLASVLTLAVTAFLLGNALRGSAVRARAAVYRRLESNEPDVRRLYGGATADAIRGRVASMVVWPSSYMSPNLLAMLLIVGVAAIMFVQVGLFMFGAIAALAVTKVVKGLA